MEIIAKVMGINTSDGLINLTVQDVDKNQYNIKASMNSASLFSVGYIYSFIVEKVVAERISYQLIEFTKAEDLNLEASNEVLRGFLPSSPMSLEDSEKFIYDSIEKIQSENIKVITKILVDRNKKDYFIYPAATRMHHAYVGGLAYHSIGMIKLADSFIENYPYLKRDYLYAGIILHDVGKIRELTGIQGTEYTLDGQMLGHLVIGALEIAKIAKELNLEEDIEIKTLEHMLISHHGQVLFGAAKRPMTPEAVALWYIDTIDSKFRVLGEELDKTLPGHYTDTIGVLDKIKIYKE